MSDYWRAVYEVARKDALQQVRTKRLIVLGSILVVSLLFITLVIPWFVLGIGDAPEEIRDEIGAIQNFAFLFFLSAPVIGGLFLLQVLAIVVTADAVCSEWQRRTVFLVLSKPVPRSAFVLGKFCGATGPLLVLVLGVLFLVYLLLIAIYPGAPDATEWGRFLGMLGLLGLGMVAFSALGLFFSSLTRSTTPSLAFALLVALVVFPVVAGISDYVLLADEINNRVEDRDSARYDWSHYLSPASAMLRSPDVVVEEDIPLTFSFLFPQAVPQSTWGSVASSLGFTALFLGLSLLTVVRRDFD
jgi:ABC-type transport system involved in multi-copper enzyme maturation permease subunit